ncbi:polyhydroxyalkanoate synthesis repressor PhaR [Parvularcula maris]|uniref:Polyhydroxyalkanoate synthesis repressor PhaR n=1 Tax=Parvularcula maris TaxID=2965077 RepID=A0A9X2L8R2_9PROT|nr:polyhydroxyalkanoate synthesis repressor PhaR [Parvularcula maris]MCQ8184282.1 polyhydroxyalkanoate synthesis repressor PhaR [Parvularcula maris]
MALEQPSPAEGKPDAQETESIVIKKYANRRLYNTKTSTYVTLETLAGMVRAGEEFVVVDAKSGDDLTRAVLAQIIFEQETKGQNLLPVRFLRQLIGLYGDNLQSFVPSYLEASMEAFRKNQESMRQSLSEAFATPAGGMQIFENAARQNMALFEQGMAMFGLKPPQHGGGAAAKEGEVEALRAEIERLKEELAKKG